MEPLRPVLWGQGTFLRPQHFQQQDAYHEARLQRALQMVQPFYWGVRSLAINETALSNFMCEIDRCEMILRDGSMIQYNIDPLPSNAKIEPRSFEPVLEPEGRPLGIHLGVRRVQWEDFNVCSQTGPSNTEREIETRRRFNAQEAVVPDLFAENEQRGTASVRFLVYDVQILFDSDLPQAHGYELLKIGEVVRVSEGQAVVLSQRYIPPALGVSASPVLSGMLREMRDLLTAKSRALAEFKPQQSMQTLEIGPREIGFMLMMQMVNRYTPLFHHHLEIPGTHPSVFYALLRQLIGEFSSFSQHISVLGGPLSDYRHDRLWECFSTAIQLAKTMLAGLTRGPDRVVSLTYDGEYFSAQLDEPFFQPHHRYYLSIDTDMQPNEVLNRLSESGKVSSRDDIEELRRRALSGVRLDYQEAPPEALPRRPRCMYFAIDQHSPSWRLIEQQYNISIYCELPEETGMQLMLIADR